MMIEHVRLTCRRTSNRIATSWQKQVSLLWSSFSRSKCRSCWGIHNFLDKITYQVGLMNIPRVSHELQLPRYLNLNNIWCYHIPMRDRWYIITSQSQSNWYPHSEYCKKTRILLACNDRGNDPEVTEGLQVAWIIRFQAVLLYIYYIYIIIIYMYTCFNCCSFLLGQVI